MDKNEIVLILKLHLNPIKDNSFQTNYYYFRTVKVTSDWSNMSRDMKTTSLKTSLVNKCS